jgi:Spy/CpxP family protein refolding chaperone
MKIKTLVNWLTPFAVAAVLVGAGTVLAIPNAPAAPAEEEAMEVGSQDNDGRGHHAPRGFMRMGRAFRHLDLTPEQRESLHSMRDEVSESLKEAHKNLFAARKALKDLVHEGAEAYDIRQAAEKVGIAEGEAAVLMAQQFARIKEILTPEQNEKLEKLLSEAGSELRERRHRFHEKDPGR